MKRMQIVRAALVLAVAAVAIAGCKQEDLQSEAAGIPAGFQREGGITTITATMPNSDASQKLAYEYDGDASKLRVKWKAGAGSETFYAVLRAEMGGVTKYASCTKFTNTNVEKSASAEFMVGFYNKDNDKWENDIFSKNVREVYAIYGGNLEEHFKNPDPSSTPPDPIPLMLDGQTGKLTDLDKFNYMYATGIVKDETDVEGNASLNLQFNHLVSVLHLKGNQLPVSGPGNEISSIAFFGQGIRNAASIQLVEDGSLVFSGSGFGQVDVLECNFEVSETGKLNEDIYIAFFPNPESNGKNMFIDIKVNNSPHYIYSILLKAPDNGFEAGKVYLITKDFGEAVD